MKLILSAACLLFLSAFSAVPASAQKVETQADLFTKISGLTKTKKAEDQVKAYQLSKEYLAKYGSKEDDETKKIKDFLGNYQMATLGKHIDDGKTAEAFTFGKEILTREAENSFVTANLAYAGYQALQTKKDKTFVQDSIQYAKQTLQLYEAKKLPKSFEPFTDEAEATALMYYILAHLAVDTNPAESAQNFYKAVQYNSKIKNNSYPYYIIALYYEKEFEKAAKAFDAKYPAGTAQSAAMAADEAKLVNLMKAMQDAYARSIKLGETDNAASVGAWKQRYNAIYAFVNQSDKGSAEFLANVLNTPMPAPVAP